jgi:NAD(P)-dependent dehydrogenase (short-subunit alcohol dehydrogenase family)
MTKKIPDQTGRVALITGANTGIGRVTAIELARAGATVYLACRSHEKTAPVLAEIAALGKGEAHFLPLDLGDLHSVRGCAEAFLATGQPLHLLINNAGLAGAAGLSASGFELTFGVCHVGHFLLTRLLLERLRASTPARIVVVASRAHRHARGIDFAVLRAPTSGFNGLPEYAVAKLANILFARQLAKELAGSGVTTYALHPGVVATDVWRHAPGFLSRLLKPFMRTAEDGAATTLYCATAPDCARQTGLYYADRAVLDPSRVAQDDALAQRLWDESLCWTDSA